MVFCIESAIKPLSRLKQFVICPNFRCQSTLTDSAFRHLSNLQPLSMRECNESMITDETFRHLLTSVQSLSMVFCNQSTITDEAFRHLWKLQLLDMEEILRIKHLQSSHK